MNPQPAEESPTGGPQRGVTGEHTHDGVPRGVTSLTPYVAVTDVAGAAEFYHRVFCARVVSRTRMGEAVIHAQLDFGNGYLHLEAPNPDGGGLAVDQGEVRTSSLSRTIVVTFMPSSRMHNFSERR